MISLGLKNQLFLNDAFRRADYKLWNFSEFRVTENRDLKGSGEQI